MRRRSEPAAFPAAAAGGADCACAAGRLRSSFSLLNLLQLFLSTCPPRRRNAVFLCYLMEGGGSRRRVAPPLAGLRCPSGPRSACGGAAGGGPVERPYPKVVRKT